MKPVENQRSYHQAPYNHKNGLKNIMNSISHNATKQPDTPQKSCSIVQDF